MISTNVTNLAWTQSSAHEAYKALLIETGLKSGLGAYRYNHFAYFSSFLALVLAEKADEPRKGDFLIVDQLQSAD